jgi:hypothetical protein
MASMTAMLCTDVQKLTQCQKQTTQCKAKQSKAKQSSRGSSSFGFLGQLKVK